MRLWRLDQLAPLQAFVGRPADGGEWSLGLWMVGTPHSWLVRR